MNAPKTKIKERDEWYERAYLDLEGARLVMMQNGPDDVVASLIQQAVEKYLKGFLISQGWELVKTHDIELLLVECSKYQDEFGKYYDFGRLTTAFYYKHRYPPIPKPGIEPQEVVNMFHTAKKLIEYIHSVES
ncbi:MAG: HEPN domain-containing protein [Calditrichota bacterium]